MTRQLSNQAWILPLRKKTSKYVSRPLITFSKSSLQNSTNKNFLFPSQRYTEKENSGYVVMLKNDYDLHLRNESIKREQESEPNMQPVLSKL